jgi:hypothetical protein
MYLVGVLRLYYSHIQISSVMLMVERYLPSFRPTIVAHAFVERIAGIEPASPTWKDGVISHYTIFAYIR